jgi:hypothetical protein
MSSPSQSKPTMYPSFDALFSNCNYEIQSHPLHCHVQSSPESRLQQTSQYQGLYLSFVHLYVSIHWLGFQFLISLYLFSSYLYFHFYSHFTVSLICFSCKISRLKVHLCNGSRCETTGTPKVRNWVFFFLIQISLVVQGWT